MTLVRWRGPLQPDARGSLRLPRDGDSAAPRPYPARARTEVTRS